jgi:8-oxo-dGTP diphosphatase
MGLASQPAGVAIVEYTRRRIRCAALVVRDARVLLVKHVQPGHSERWVPPGGGVKGDESLYECARR